MTEVFSDTPLHADVLDHDNWKVAETTEEQNHFAALEKEINDGQLQPQM